MKKRVIKKIIWILFCLFLTGIKEETVSAWEVTKEMPYGNIVVYKKTDYEKIDDKKIEDIEIDYEELDYEEIQNALEGILKESSFDFKEAVKSVMEGENVLSPERILNVAFEVMKQAVLQEKEVIARVLVIAVAGAVFVNFSNVFKSSAVADVSFFVTYLLLFSAMTTSFYSISQTAERALHSLLDFMRALLPSYFIAVTFATGSTVSFAFYEMAMMLIFVAEYIIVKCVLPLVHIYFVIRLVNYISKEDYLSKAAELLETLVKWAVRSILGITVGYNTIQGLIVPAAEHVKNSVVLKTAKLLPGIGNVFGAVAESVLGAGVLVKNAVGTVGMVVVILIMAVPIIKIGSYCIVYKLSTALIQPVLDKRILECMEGAVKGASLLLYVLSAGTAMFLLTIAIVMASTNRVLV